MGQFDDDDEAGPTMFAPRGRLSPDAAAADTIGHYLVAVSGASPGRRVEIGSTPVTIGRDPKQTLVFADTELSRLHARVSRVGDQVVVEDMGSTNGTFVDGERLTQPQTINEGNVLQVGGQLLKYERRARTEVKRSEDLERDLRKASNYVFSLLPAPITEGPVRAAWRFVPSAQLGGDAFGYYWLDPQTFVFYLVDVSGHGVGSAMHSVTVMNVLRQRTLPNVDFEHPAEVLASLNTTFQMDAHNGMYFTMWYGVYRTGDRSLAYGAGGHHPAFLVPADRKAAEPLGSPALMVGAVPDLATYREERATIPAGSSLYLFSDGVFEIVTSDQQRWALEDFVPRLLEPEIPGTPEPERLYQQVKQAAGPKPLEDDFSLVVLTFP